MTDCIIARDVQTGAWIRVEIDAGFITAVDPCEAQTNSPNEEIWIAPAFWDIQTNGRWGISYSDPDLTVEQVVRVVRAQAELGTARLCPTLISASERDFVHGLKTIAQACDTFPDVASMVLGIHLEGPYLSSLEGYRGAHPEEALRDPDWSEFERFQGASGGRTVLMTLAPERQGAIEFIQKAVAAGIVIALGHTAADGPTIRAAIEAGATLSTHLGNGIAQALPRHPNPIWHQAADDRIWASLIADGRHLDPATLFVLVRAKTPERIVLVSDASPLAGLPPGRYGAWEVAAEGKIVVAGTPYLAGSNQDLITGVNQLMLAAGMTLAQAIATVTINPARLLGREVPTIAAGSPADLVVLRSGNQGQPIELLRTCVNPWKADS